MLVEPHPSQFLSLREMGRRVNQRLADIIGLAMANGLLISAGFLAQDDSGNPRGTEFIEIHCAVY